MLEQDEISTHPNGRPAEDDPYETINLLRPDQLKGAFHGIVQHSFALQLPRAHEFRETSGWLPRRSRQSKSATSFNKRQRKHHQQAAERLVGAFEDRTGRFRFRVPAQLVETEGSKHSEGSEHSDKAGAYSWLLSNRHARLEPQPLALLSPGAHSCLPAALGWAEHPSRLPDGRAPLWQGFVFAQRGRSRWILPDDEAIANDLLIERVDCNESDEANEMSRVLFQLWAHWRSRLFGVPLANRFFNVFLPHAILTLDAQTSPEDAGSVARGPAPEGSFFVQPFVSLVREPDRSHCRRTFTFTVLLIPIEPLAGNQIGQRTMSLREIEASVRGTWGLAANRVGANRRRFSLEGPLRGYCENMQHCLPGGALTTREWVEAAIYCTTRMRRDRLKPWWHVRSVPDDAELGDKVLSAIASSRMSAITVVDPELSSEQVRQWHETANAGEQPAGVNTATAATVEGHISPYPASMPKLVRAVAGRVYLASVPAYRVDSPFLDMDSYAEVTVPAARTLITTTTTTPKLQHGLDGSGLTQSVAAGYMTLGAATAQALIRSSYHEIEAHSDPKQFGEISKEFTRDFHEIYDLDIAWESYKRTYRAILEQFDIIRDYDALRRKLEMLFDSTVAEFTEWQHTRLWFVTWLLVFGTMAVIVVTLLSHK
jgi:hypothetical protein